MPAPVVPTCSRSPAHSRVLEPPQRRCPECEATGRTRPSPRPCRTGASGVGGPPQPDAASGTQNPARPPPPPPPPESCPHHPATERTAPLASRITPQDSPTHQSIRQRHDLFSIKALRRPQESKQVPKYVMSEGHTRVRHPVYERRPTTSGGN